MLLMVAFSVKDAYIELSNAPILQESMLFKNIWHCDGP